MPQIRSDFLTTLIFSYFDYLETLPSVINLLSKNGSLYLNWNSDQLQHFLKQLEDPIPEFKINSQNFNMYRKSYQDRYILKLRVEMEFSGLDKIEEYAKGAYGF